MGFCRDLPCCGYIFDISWDLILQISLIFHGISFCKYLWYFMGFHFTNIFDISWVFILPISLILHGISFYQYLWYYMGFHFANTFDISWDCILPIYLIFRGISFYQYLWYFMGFRFTNILQDNLTCPGAILRLCRRKYSQKSWLNWKIVYYQTTARDYLSGIKVHPC